MTTEKYTLSLRDRQDLQSQLARFEKECGPVITVRPAVMQQTPVYTQSTTQPMGISTQHSRLVH